jgi:hypothetical protein
LLFALGDRQRQQRTPRVRWTGDAEEKAEMLKAETLKSGTLKTEFPTRWKNTAVVFPVHLEPLVANCRKWDD